MPDESDILTKYAERRRAFLLRTATTSPVVSLLLEQSAHPARAATYENNINPVMSEPPETTVPTGTFPPTSTSSTTFMTILPSTTAPTTTEITSPTTTEPITRTTATTTFTTTTTGLPTTTEPTTTNATTTFTVPHLPTTATTVK